MEKVCIKCGETKPLSEFYKHKNAKDGHQSTCKVCQCISKGNWYRANTGRAAASSKAWTKANPERMADLQRTWKEANLDREAARKKAWRKAHPDRAAATNRHWRQANRDYLRAATRAWSEANPDRIASTRLQREYGISLVEYDKMLRAQTNRCAICGKTPAEEGRRLAVDHDHETDKLRGVLCGNCNRGLGLFMHDPELLQRAIAYLEKWAELEAEAKKSADVG